MSHSSLSAQLASLNASAAGGKNAGSTLGSSRRHDDAIGRGIAHSATHGHTVAASSPKFKPSVLYADAKTASDVPLTTLRENSVSSLRQLARLTENDAFVEPAIVQSLMGAHSLNLERGLATRAENDKIDKDIVGLLNLLSTAMGESSSACLTASLHVIEYLLRRYDIHLRASTAEGLLLAALPHHELPVFLRVLQLLDLASMPTWVFLRPHAAKGAPPPSRTLIAKRASRDDAIVAHCCEVAKKAALIHARECDNNDSLPSQQRPTPRRGVSRIISFAAAVLVEAFSMQTTIPTNQGSISEPTLRSVFPFILSACGDNKASSKQYSSRWSLGILCPYWRGFGHLLAATISERSVLSPEISQVLATTLMKGSLEINRFMAGGGGEDEQTNDERMKLAADCILVAMTVLANAGEDTPQSESDSVLTILVTNQVQSKANVKHTLGYSLSTSTYRLMRKHNLLAKAMGHLNVDRNVEVAPLMASLLTLGIASLFNDSSRKEVESDLFLVLELTREPSLESVWTDSKFNITASFAATLVSMFANHQTDEEVESRDAESIRSVLDALLLVDPTQCDAGVAHAVTTVCRKGGGKGSRSRRKKRVSLLTGSRNLALENAESDGDVVMGNDAEASELLPPRVALEHPDKSVRLNAISRVTEELTGMDAQDEKGEPLEQALIRRMNTEDDVQVAASAGNSLVKVLTMRKTSFLGDAFVNMTATALVKWSVFRADLEKAEGENDSESMTVDGDRLGVLFSTLVAAAYATRWLIESSSNELTDMTESQATMICGIVAHLDFMFFKSENRESQFEEVALHAADALELALCVEHKGKKKPSKRVRINTVKKLLASNEKCTSVLKQSCSSKSRSQLADVKSTGEALLERRYIWVMLLSLSQYIEKGSPDSDAVSAAMMCSLHILRSCQKGETFQEAEVSELLKCLQVCSRDICSQDAPSVPETIISLASIASLAAYQDVSRVAIKYFCKSVVSVEGVGISPVSVLMEACTRVSASADSVERLLSIVSDCLSSTSVTDGSAANCLVSAMMLLGSDMQRIRKATLQILSQISQNAETDSAVIKDICYIASSGNGNDGMYSTLLMNGEAALPKLVASALQSSNEPSKLQEYLIRHCFRSALASDGSRNSEWLPIGSAAGGCRAAAFGLKVLEVAGETAFPLAMRWKYAGKEIVEIILQAAQSAEDRQDTPLHVLIDPVATMLKGVMVTDARSLPQSSVVISTGPDRKGGRVRSYSVGKMEGVSYVKPYPDDMFKALIACISPPLTETHQKNPLARELILGVLNNVFTRSWGEGVFKELPDKKRRELGSCLLNLLSVFTEDAVAEMALQELPLRASDISCLLKDADPGDEYLLMVTFLSDWVRTNAMALIQDSDLSQLVSAFFEILSSLSSATSERNVDIDESEYTRYAILQSLFALSQSSKDSMGATVVQQNMTGHVKLIVGLVGGSVDNSGTDGSRVRPFVSIKAKSSAISLLTNLCSMNPTAVVNALVPALMATMISASYSDGENVRASRGARDAFMGVIPVFCSHGPLFHLVVDFISECQKFTENGDKLLMYENLIDAVVSAKKSDGGGASVGSIVAAFLASELYKSQNDMEESSRVDSFEESGVNESVVTFASNLIAFAPADVQIDGILQLLRYLNQFVGKLAPPTAESDQEMDSNDATADPMVVPFDEIEKLALHGLERNGDVESRGKDYSFKERCHVMRLSTGIVALIMDTLSSGSVSRLLKNSEGLGSALCLKFWQDLLCIQATVFDLQPLPSSDESSSIENRFWESIKELVTEALESLQNLLPAHTFLASASSLIREETVSEELRARAVRLVAEKAAEAEPHSAEATIFLDMLPTFVSLLAPSTDNTRESATLLRQSALIAIEHFARSIYIHSAPEKPVTTHSKEFLSALEKVSEILDSKRFVEMSEDGLSVADDEAVQLQCTAALCSSTLVRVLQVRCLPLLPKIVEPLITSLISANTYLISTSAVGRKEERITMKMMQVSSLRAVGELLEALPQFLLPYLGKLLSPLGLPSRALRIAEGDQDTPVKSTVELIQGTLASRTPSRQLVPVACGALGRDDWGCVELQSLLAIVEASVKSAKKGEIPSLTRGVLKALKIVYERGGIDVDGDRIFDAGHKLLLALVFKISEALLRPLYSELREWRGSIDPKNSDKHVASRRLAFWSLSAVLAKELRSIFLPCMTTVVTDAVEELNSAASSLCSKTSEKSSGGHKRRRLAMTVEDDAETSAINSFLHLRPLLLCLESALKSDAHEGGNWSRADDGDRFNALLAPLGMLLQCRIPSNLLIERANRESPSETYNPFQRVVLGTGQDDGGSVIACLTALAAAAGNEQLWKPLNHRVLEACDNGRSEVRMAGVSCLLSLMKTLGEEYMVLLPECLPTLAELLEDSDEEIARIAQECVSIGEELLGESLQDRLR